MRKLIVFLFFIIPLFKVAQEPDFSQIKSDHVEFQRKGMFFLGGWAVTNITASAYMMSRTSDWHYHFYQMNVIWHVVNLGIATGGYFAENNADMTGLDVYKQYADFGKILLFNAGLDLAYMATGLYLQERAKNVSKRKDMMKGYGKSVILQGEFLFVFDAIFYGLNQLRMQEIFTNQNIDISLTGNMIQFSLHF